jgi:hypothetical protein
METGTGQVPRSSLYFFGPNSSMRQFESPREGSFCADVGPHTQVSGQAVGFSFGGSTAINSSANRWL